MTPRTLTASRPVTTRLLAASLLLAAAAGALALSFDSAPGPSAPPSALHPDLRPLRVASGDEIATGFAVGGNRVVTVAHALGGEATVDGVRARVRRVDRRSDLALLTVPGLSEPAIATAAAAEGALLRLLRVRDGRASRVSVHVRRAIVAHVKAQGAARPVTRPALELAARVAAGDSGSPVISSSGALAGVIFATSRARENTAYAVDAAAVARLLARE